MAHRPTILEDPDVGQKRYQLYKDSIEQFHKALSEGYTKSTNITVHVLEGNYSGTLNTNLRIPTTVDVTIKGAVFAVFFAT